MLTVAGIIDSIPPRMSSRGLDYDTYGIFAILESRVFVFISVYKFIMTIVYVQCACLSVSEDCIVSHRPSRYIGLVYYSDVLDRRGVRLSTGNEIATAAGYCLIN